MKLKGVGFFEAHVEKLVLGVMVAVAAGVLVVQFATQPNMVQVSGREYPPERAFDPVADLARQREAEMTSLSPPLPEVGDRDAALARVEAELLGPVSVGEEVVALGEAIEIDVAGGVAGEDARYAEVTPPAPARPLAAGSWGTLHPAAVASSESLQGLVGENQPYDLPMVSVEATYDGQALAELFRTDPDGAGGELRPLPLNWWQGVEALGLVLERQRRLPDGSWSQPETILGSVDADQSLVALLAADHEAGRLTREQLSADARGAYENAKLYRRPEPPAMIAGTPWQPPTEVLASAGEDSEDRIADLVRRLSTIDREIATTERRIEDFANDDDRSRRPGGREGGGRDRGPRDEGDGDREDPRIARLRERVEEFNTRRDEVAEELLALGVDPETGERFEVQTVDDTTDERLLAADEVRLWGHDLTVRPGETYRYRVRLAVNNPAYGRQSVLREGQREMAERPVLLSEPSPWGDPVVAMPREAFFLVSANDGRSQSLGPGEPVAVVEAFTFYYGFYRRTQVSLRPGEMVAGAAPVPEDLTFLAADETRSDQTETIVRGREGARRGGGDDEQADPALAVPDEVPVAIGTYLVDVTSELNDTREGLVERSTRPVAYFAGTDRPELVRRAVGEDRQGLLYARLSASASAGERQGELQAVDIPEVAAPRQREERDTGRPVGDTGGKGAGGG